MKPTITVYWSAEDACYLASRTDYPSVVTHGASPIEAAFELGAALAAESTRKNRPPFTFPEIELTEEEKAEIEEDSCYSRGSR